MNIQAYQIFLVHASYNMIELCFYHLYNISIYIYICIYIYMYNLIMYNHTQIWYIVIEWCRCGSASQTHMDSKDVSARPSHKARCDTGWWLGLNPSEKYEFVNWGMMTETQYSWENKKWQPNHQPGYVPAPKSFRECIWSRCSGV